MVFSSLNKTDLYLNLLEQNSVSTTKPIKDQKWEMCSQGTGIGCERLHSILSTHILVHFKEIPDQFIDRIYGMTWVSSEGMFFMNVY